MNARSVISKTAFSDLHQMTSRSHPAVPRLEPRSARGAFVGGWGAGSFSLMSRTEAAAHLRSLAAKPWRSITLMASISTGNTHAATKPELTVTRAISRTTQSSCKALRDALGMNRIVSTAVGAVIISRGKHRNGQGRRDRRLCAAHDLRHGLQRLHASATPAITPPLWRQPRYKAAIRTRAHRQSCFTTPVSYNQTRRRRSILLPPLHGRRKLVNSGLLQEASSASMRRTTTVSPRVRRSMLPASRQYSV